MLMNDHRWRERNIARGAVCVFEEVHAGVVADGAARFADDCDECGAVRGVVRAPARGGAGETALPEQFYRRGDDAFARFVTACIAAGRWTAKAFDLSHS